MGVLHIYLYINAVFGIKNNGECLKLRQWNGGDETDTRDNLF